MPVDIIEAEAVQSEVIFCSDCNTVIESGTRCDSCQDHYGECVNCGDEIHYDDTFLNDEGDSYCQRCYDEHYFHCSDCGHEVEHRDGHEAHGDYYCHDCFFETFTICDDCGRTIDRDDVYYSEHDDANYCERCHRYHNDNNKLHEYHRFEGDTKFYGHGKLFLGVELETDEYSDRDGAIEDIFEYSNNEALFHMEDDGSLSNGIEIISMPCTLEFHKNQFPYKDILAAVIKHGGKSHDTTTCGLHIHFSSNFYNEIDTLKLVYLFEKFFNDIIRFSRRTGNSWRHYAANYDTTITDTDFQYPKAKLDSIKCNSGRYQAVNLQNRNTIEIRIFKGTLKYETIMACLEFTDLIVRFAKTHTVKELQAVTWQDFKHHISNNAIDKYNNLKNYINERSL